MLTRTQQQRVSDLVSLYLDYLGKIDQAECIVKGGASMLDKFRGFRSRQKPSDTIGTKADRLKACQTTKVEQSAHALMKRLTVREREVLCYWPAVQRRHNPDTQKPWLLGDVAAKLNFSMAQYLQQRDLAAFRLLELDSQLEKANM